MIFSLVDKDIMFIGHGKEKLIFNISEFSKTKLITHDNRGGMVDPFIEINSFLKDKISFEDQDKIFAVYKTVKRELTQSAMDIETMKKVLNESFITIFNIIKVEDIEEYLDKRNMFKIPPEIKEEFTGEYSEDRTYNKAKYKGLISLAIAGRFAIPIWGEFTPLHKSPVGSVMMPLSLLKMLQNTSLVESKQFAEFELYTSSTVAAGKHDKAFTAAIMGSELNRMLNLAANFTKKVAVALNLESQSLAHTIYNFTANNGAYGGSSASMMREKKGINTSADDDERSVLEKYSLREQMSQGDISMMEYWLDNIEKVMRHVCSDIPDELIERAEDLADYLIDNFRPNEINIRICQWVLTSQVPPNTLLYVSHETTCRYIAATVYVLIHLGYDIFAAMCLSEEKVDELGTSVTFKSTRKEIPKDIMEQLDNYYRVKPRTKDKQNIAASAITDYYVKVNTSVFKVCSDEATLSHLRMKVLNKYDCFTIGHSFTTDLALLFIKIVELSNLKTI